MSKPVPKWVYFFAGYGLSSAGIDLVKLLLKFTA